MLTHATKVEGAAVTYRISVAFMPRCVLFTAALLAGCAAPSAGPEPLDLSYARPAGPDVQAWAQYVAPAYVRLRIFAPDAMDADGRAAWQTTVNDGSGTLVDQGLVVTAAHLIPNPKLSMAVQTMDGRWHQAELLDWAPERELALLRIQGVSGPIPFRAEPLRAGEPTLAIGTPERRPAVVLTGRVLEPRMHGRIAYRGYRYEDAVLLEMTAGPGYSGGPVVDEQGQLIGIVASFALREAGRAVAPPRAAAVPATAIRAYIEEIEAAVPLSDRPRPAPP